MSRARRVGGRRASRDHGLRGNPPVARMWPGMVIRPRRVIAQRNDHQPFADPLLENEVRIGLADTSSLAIDGCGRAAVAELVDATDLGSVRATCGGSNPSGRTIFLRAPPARRLLCLVSCSSRVRLSARIDCFDNDRHQAVKAEEHRG
jgi:hypothetical protein